MTLHMPAFLFKAWPVLRFFVAIGVLLFIVQVVSTTVYDGVLNHQLNERAKLDREMTQIQGTLDYLSNTTNSFFNDENRLYARFSLPMQDEASRELGTGGSIRFCSARRPRSLNGCRSLARPPSASRASLRTTMLLSAT